MEMSSDYSMPNASNSGSQRRWLVHDLVVGAFAGAAIGTVSGLLVLARFDNKAAFAVTVIAPVMITVAALRWERRRRHAVGPVTVLAWVAMSVSLGFMALLVTALRRFT